MMMERDFWCNNMIGKSESVIFQHNITLLFSENENFFDKVCFRRQATDIQLTLLLQSFVSKEMMILVLLKEICLHYYIFYNNTAFNRIYIIQSSLCNLR